MAGSTLESGQQNMLPEIELLAHFGRAGWHRCPTQFAELNQIDGQRNKTSAMIESPAIIKSPPAAK